MIRLLIAAAITFACACAHTPAAQHAQQTAGQVATDATACAAAEASAVAAGTSILDVENQVKAAIGSYKACMAGSGSGSATPPSSLDCGIAAVETAIEKLIGTYGEPIVACVVVKGISGSIGGSAAATARPQIASPPGSFDAVSRELVVIHQWRAP